MSLYDLYKLNLDLQKLETEALQIPEIVSGREYVSNRNGGLQIHDSHWNNELKGFYTEKFLFREIKSFLGGIGGNIWLNINYPGSYNSPHIHQGDRSGVYYVKVPEGSGDLVFTKTMETIIPKPGMLITFDAKEEHAVEPNLSDEPRISFAFNYFRKKL